MVRDIVRSVQNLRKESGLEVTDRIKLFISGSDAVKAAVEAFEDNLLSETLGDSWSWESREGAFEGSCGDDEACTIAWKRPDLKRRILCLLSAGILFLLAGCSTKPVVPLPEADPLASLPSDDDFISWFARRLTSS